MACCTRRLSPEEQPVEPVQARCAPSAGLLQLRISDRGFRRASNRTTPTKPGCVTSMGGKASFGILLIENWIGALRAWDHRRRTLRGGQRPPADLHGAQSRPKRVIESSAEDRRVMPILFSNGSRGAARDKRYERLSGVCVLYVLIWHLMGSAGAKRLG